eukprot:14316624-Heterocapsa_arctica.AAC.1
MPRGAIPTHRPVKLVLRLAGLWEPVDTLSKPRSLVDQFPARGKTPKGEEPKPYGPAWRGPNLLESTANKSWD